MASMATSGGLAASDPARADTDNAMQTAQHTFWAEGIYGQAIAINPSEKSRDGAVV